MGSLTFIQWLEGLAGRLVSEHAAIEGAQVEGEAEGRTALRVTVEGEELVWHARPQDEGDAWLRTASASWNLDPYRSSGAGHEIERLVRRALTRHDPGSLAHARVEAPSEAPPSEAPERDAVIEEAKRHAGISHLLRERSAPARAALSEGAPHQDHPVSVHTEWGRLREVIVGNSIGWNLDGFDELFEVLYWETLHQSYSGPLAPEVNRRYTEERQADLDAFAETLRGLGVVVRRPEQLTEASRIQTPTFSAVTNAVDAPRDMFLCLGDEIIETPPTDKNRYYLSFQMRRIFSDYFRRGARWTFAPRPMLQTHDNVSWRDVDELHPLEAIDPLLDVAFDAANCLKFGRDIIMNVGNKQHELGAIWLQRHLGDAYKVHPVRVCDYHIDGTMMPLKPGVMLVNPALAARAHWLPPELQRWTQIVVEPDEDERFDYPDSHVQLASFVGMGVNVLSIDERRVCVRARNTRLCDTLDRAGFEVIPIPLRHCVLFGGSLHCSTLDVRRDDEALSYF